MVIMTDEDNKRNKVLVTCS